MCEKDVCLGRTSDQPGKHMPIRCLGLSCIFCLGKQPRESRKCTLDTVGDEQRGLEAIRPQRAPTHHQPAASCPVRKEQTAY